MAAISDMAGDLHTRLKGSMPAAALNDSIQGFVLEILCLARPAVACCDLTSPATHALLQTTTRAKP